MEGKSGLTDESDGWPSFWIYYDRGARLLAENTQVKMEKEEELVALRIHVYCYFQSINTVAHYVSCDLQSLFPSLSPPPPEP